MYRLLRLQRLTRRAVRARRSEEAAFLARAALETCIVGLYCLFSGEAVARLSAANYRAARKVVSYIRDEGLVSEEAIESAVTALGETGPDLNIRYLADKLASDHDLTIAQSLYSAYYVPLSHFFVHANAFTLMRHLDTDGTVQPKMSEPWARRPAARLGDACTGLLAANIAQEAGGDREPFLAYAQAHLDRLLTPAVVGTFRHAAHTIRWRRIPAILRELVAVRAYIRGRGLADNPDRQEARIREGFGRVLGPLLQGAPEGMFTLAMEELVARVLDEMRRLGEDASAEPGEASAL
jgi:hypothetical protein